MGNHGCSKCGNPWVACHCPPLADAQATVEALRRERDFFETAAATANRMRVDTERALDAEREKVKGLESEGVKLFEWRLALHSLTPGGSEFCTPDACEQWVRKSRTSQHEYIIEQIKQRKGLQTQLSQLQALVREVANAGVAFEDGRIPYKEVQIDRDWFDRARATLDATTPALTIKEARHIALDVLYKAEQERIEASKGGDGE